MVKVSETCPDLNCSVREQILPDNRCCNVCKGEFLALHWSSPQPMMPIIDTDGLSLARPTRGGITDPGACSNWASQAALFVFLHPVWTFHLLLAGKQDRSPTMPIYILPSILADAFCSRQISTGSLVNRLNKLIVRAKQLLSL